MGDAVENVAIKGAKEDERHRQILSKEESVLDEAVGHQLTGQQTSLKNLPKNKQENKGVFPVF